MIECDWIVCAGGATLDKMTGNVTIFKIFDGVTAAGFPLLCPPMAVVGHFFRDANDPTAYDCRFRVNVAGNELVSAPIRIEFQGTRKTVMVMDIQGFPVTNAGAVTFDVLDGERIVGSCEFLVHAPPAGQGFAAMLGPNAIFANVQGAIHPRDQANPPMAAADALPQPALPPEGAAGH